MNLKKLFRNQTEKKLNLCLIVFLFIVFGAVRVFYVSAAEVGWNEVKEGDSIWEDSFKKKNADIRDEGVNTGNYSEKDSIETVPAGIVGTSNIQSKHQEMERIRMANEDAIQVAHSITAEYHLSEKEYNILTRIVEAEAGNLDKKSKILVANVILNRMNNEEFPDTVEEIVFQNVNGAVQFSPIADGRYYTVKVTESTKESVDRALAGEDYSEGALYFMERSMSAASNVNWFDTCLTKLFKYQSHEFFK